MIVSSEKTSHKSELFLNNVPFHHIRWYKIQRLRYQNSHFVSFLWIKIPKQESVLLFNLNSHFTHDSWYFYLQNPHLTRTLCKISKCLYINRKVLRYENCQQPVFACHIQWVIVDSEYFCYGANNRTCLFGVFIWQRPCFFKSQQ